MQRVRVGTQVAALAASGRRAPGVGSDREQSKTRLYIGAASLFPQGPNTNPTNHKLGFLFGGK